MLALALCGVLAAMAVVMNWSLHRVDAIGRTNEFPVIRFGLGLALALGAGVPVYRHLSLEHRLSQAAAQLSGREGVSVSCQTLSQAWVSAHTERGYVAFDATGRPGREAVISHDTCDDLQGWLADPDAEASLDQIIAVHVLTHEAMHLSGLVNEAVTECAAVQRDALTVQLLGGSPQRAQLLAQNYLRTVYPTLRETYTSPHCTAGGAMDEGLDSAPWAEASDPAAFDAGPAIARSGSTSHGG